MPMLVALARSLSSRSRSRSHRPPCAGAVSSRPIRLVVPVAAGGGIDTAFRAIAPAWSELLGQQVVIENKPGGGQVLGSDFSREGEARRLHAARRGRADRVQHCARTQAAVRRDQGLHAAVDRREPPLLVVVHPNVPVKSMAELVAYAKAQPQPLQYTTGGIGSYGHLWWEMLRARQGVPGQHIAYNGIAPAMKDVMGGQVPLLIDAIVPIGRAGAGGNAARHRDRRRASARSRCRTSRRWPNRASPGSMPRRSTASSVPAGMDARCRAEASFDAHAGARRPCRARQAAVARLRRRRRARPMRTPS